MEWILAAFLGYAVAATAVPECCIADDPVTVWRFPAPNNVLVCPLGVCQAEASFAPPEFKVRPDELFAALTTILANEPRVQVTAADPGARRFEWVQRSATLGFPDVVSARVITRPEGSTLAIYSRSRYGLYDMGENRRRVDRLLANLILKLGTDKVVTGGPGAR